MKNILSATIGGILTLGVEMTGGRYLAPYFGSSLNQWAALIGVALVSYCLGYFYFENLHQRGPIIPLIAGALYTASIPLWFESVINPILTLSFSLASILAASLVIGLPSVLWASLLPFIQKFSDQKSSSKMLAWSAFGNLTGIWGVVFFCIPTLGTRQTFFVLGALSLLLSALWVNGSPKKATLVILSFGSIFLRSPSNGLVSKDSQYQNISVFDGPVRYFALDGNVQFGWDEKNHLSKTPQEAYFNYATAAVEWTKETPAKSVLIFGLGGGLTPWQIKMLFPKTKITIFELDPEVVDIGKKHLPLSKIPDSEIRIGDGRILLGQTTQKFDYIFLDPYLNSYVPFHLTTIEFFKIVKARLNPGGIVVANFLTSFRETGLLPKLTDTIHSIFPFVGTMDLPETINTLMVASEEEVSFSPSEGLAELSSIHKAAKSLFQLSRNGSALLTDDKNDTEQRLFETRKRLPIF